MGNTSATERPSYFPINASGQQERYSNLLPQREVATVTPQLPLWNKGSSLSHAQSLNPAGPTPSAEIAHSTPVRAYFDWHGLAIATAFLFIVVGVSAFATQHSLLPKLPRVLLSHQPRVEFLRGGGDTPLSASPSDCCGRTTAECFACTAGISIQRYCYQHSSENITGCNEPSGRGAPSSLEQNEAETQRRQNPHSVQRPRPSLNATGEAEAVATEDGGHGNVTKRGRRPTVEDAESRALNKEERIMHRQRSCCAMTTAPCIACLRNLTLEEYCGTKGGAKAPGCEGERAQGQAPHKESQLNGERRPRGECCLEQTAKCIACFVGRTLAEYCTTAGADAGPGCEELRASSALVRTNTSTSTSSVTSTTTRTTSRTATSRTTTRTVTSTEVIHGRGERAHEPSTTTASTTPRTSMFCFSVMLPWGYEPSLLRKQLTRRKSIFACDEAMVYSNTDMDLGEGFKTVDLGINLRCKFGGEFDTVLNTPIFKVVWRRIIHDKLFRLHDWTIKVDPDAVFFPHRLQSILRGPDQAVAAMGNGIFFNNCGYGLHGPLEVLSTRALDVYAAGVHQCEQPPQEDVYLQKCLLKLGVLQVNHFNLLAEDHCSYKDWEKCESSHVSFHPFKSWQKYQRCLGIAESRD